MCVALGDILHHERQAQCHTVGGDGVARKRFIGTLGGNVLGHAQCHAAL